ncbi:hypothetical protein [Arcobacter porcinus]|uniref:Uncharacterized protein n=1 Tax=Arcobacter porcinus TaxID=1935204 RepID=A0A5C2HDK3_9BACT|nr:hypothetical protein [Arcobacter porcinus]OCL89489.1 hypothetical protein AAX27_01912 [Aliarcobacter thereius]QEP41026.1 hypothetical protein APORC_1443 [Arcobacter porcinus]
MLKDILFLTKKVFDEALIKEENLPNPKKVYDVYRNLKDVISDLNLVANHYLALDFSEPYLQGSSWGEPIDKWRKFFNEDLEQLNESVKKYLHNLSHLGHGDFGFETYVNNIYSAKTYYAFVRDRYSVGFVEPKCSSLHMNILKIEQNKIESFYISEHKKIDLSTFEARVNLKDHLNIIKNDLETELKNLKKYIKDRYTLDDLL